MHALTRMLWFVLTSLRLFSLENPLRRGCIWTIQQWWFDAFIIFLIAANCILLAQFDPTQVTPLSALSTATTEVSWVS